MKLDVVGDEAKVDVANEVDFPEIRCIVRVPLKCVQGQEYSLRVYGLYFCAMCNRSLSNFIFETIKELSGFFKLNHFSVQSFCYSIKNSGF